MSARLLCTPPTKLTIWFLRKYVWINAPYTDALVCIARTLNIVDRAMIYEAITGRHWNVTRAYCESVRLRGYEAVTAWLHGRVDRIESAPVDICHSIREITLGFVSDSRAIRWVYKCACNGNLHPIATLHEWIDQFKLQYRPYGYEYRDLSRKCNEAGLIEALLCMHAKGMISPHNTDFTLHPKTYLILRELGYLVKSDTRGVLQCIDADMWIQDDKIQMIDNRDQAVYMCKQAIESGLALDWVHKHMTIYEMANVEVDYYGNNETIQWFIDHKIDHWMFWFDSFSIKNVMFALPRLHEDIRGVMLARSEDARIVYRLQPFAYNRDVFTELASYKVAKKIARFG
jgi:hypothetical protein